jgi:outer membrane lipoprotein-sorting protein
MKALLVLAIALFLPQEKNEAEELFKKMEEKLAKATTITVKAKGAMGAGDASFEGDLIVGEDNRARSEVKLKSGDSTRPFSAVSDGGRTQVMPAGGGEAQLFDTPEKLGIIIRKAIARGGFSAGVDALMTVRDRNADPDQLSRVSAFKLGAKEKVGERDAQIVEWDLATKYESDIKVTTWIDSKSHLPLKRTVKYKRNAIEETYSEFKLDEKIDAAKFELPKEAK